MNSSIAKLRNNLADLINRVAYGRDRVTLHRRGRPIAVLISLADAEHLPQQTAAEQHADTTGVARNTKRPSITKPAPNPKPRAQPRTTTKNQARRTKNQPVKQRRRNTPPERPTLETLRRIFQTLDPEERPKRMPMRSGLSQVSASKTHGHNRD